MELVRCILKLFPIHSSFFSVFKSHRNLTCTSPSSSCHASMITRHRSDIPPPNPPMADFPNVPRTRVQEINADTVSQTISIPHTKQARLYPYIQTQRFFIGGGVLSFFFFGAELLLRLVLEALVVRLVDELVVLPLDDEATGFLPDDGAAVV
jgi:hypothetical protein